MILTGMLDPCGGRTSLRAGKTRSQLSADSPAGICADDAARARTSRGVGSPDKPPSQDSIASSNRHLRKTEHSWHLMFFNCNDLAVEVARWIGLRSPPSWMVPHAYVTVLRELNDR